MGTISGRRGWQVAVLAVTVVAPALIAPGTAQAAPKDLIAYADEDFDEIRLVTSGGLHSEELHQLPMDEGVAPVLSWAPDGSAIAVAHEIGDDCAVTVIEVATGRGRVVTRAGFCDAPAWSPDSAHLAFAEDVGALTVVAADGSRRSTIDTDGTLPMWPLWSPTGQHVAYFDPVERDSYDLYVTRADGSSQVRLTDVLGDPSDDGGLHGAWSPDGSTLLFDRWSEDWTESDILATDPEGRSVAVVIGGAGAQHKPVYSPDGSRVAFVQDERTLLTARPDGSDRVQVHQADGDGWVNYPSWSAAGDELLFLWWKPRHGGGIGSSIHVVPAGGGDPRLKHDHSDVYHGAFSPAGVVPLRGTELACPDGRVPEDGFEDVPQGSGHEEAIDCAVWWSLAAGTDERHYEPHRPMSRAQVASVVARLVREAGGELPEAPADHFSDDDGLVHEHAINQLAEIGLVSGTSPSLFSPAIDVTRGQLATLLRGAVQHATGIALGSDADHFADDDGSVHEGAIDALADAGVATGVMAGHFAPGRSVSRAQIASFLTRAVDLVVEHGHAVPPDEREDGTDTGGDDPLPIPFP